MSSLVDRALRLWTEPLPDGDAGLDIPWAGMDIFLVDDDAIASSASGP